MIRPQLPRQRLTSSPALDGRCGALCGFDGQRQRHDGVDVVAALGLVQN